MERLLTGCSGLTEACGGEEYAEHEEEVKGGRLRDGVCRQLAERRDCPLA
jgi:hypothetical protein